MKFWVTFDDTRPVLSWALSDLRPVVKARHSRWRGWESVVRFDMGSRAILEDMGASLRARPFAVSRAV
jgi:hypothetical protein